jgi:hypothetical protein
MPIKRSHDSHGPFYQWGDHGKKYYYTANNTSSRTRAKNKAEQQSAAAHAHGY